MAQLGAHMNCIHETEVRVLPAPPEYIYLLDKMFMANTILVET